MKHESGAAIENGLANFNLLLPLIWENLSEKDRWDVGRSFAELSAEGKEIATKGIQKALLKVKGFDYVPENLRSNTYIRLASKITKVHFEFNNFYNEPPLVRSLEKLGSSIPTPAFADCMRALLCVVLGNRYGKSTGAQVSSTNILKTVSQDRWIFYFSRILPQDSEILYKITEDIPRNQLRQVLSTYSVDITLIENEHIKKMLEYVEADQGYKAEQSAKRLYNSLSR